jgi:hypothetical protein
VAKPTAYEKPAAAANPRAESWSAATGRVREAVAALLRQNRAFYAARGPAAVEERGKLQAAVEQFEKQRIAELEDAAANLDEPGRRQASEYLRQARRLAADLRAREFESAVDADVLLERYRL